MLILCKWWGVKDTLDQQYLLRDLQNRYWNYHQPREPLLHLKLNLTMACNLPVPLATDISRSEEPLAVPSTSPTGYLWTPNTHPWNIGQVPHLHTFLRVYKNAKVCKTGMETRVSSCDLVAPTPMKLFGPFTQQVFFYNDLTDVNCMLNLSPLPI